MRQKVLAIIFGGQSGEHVVSLRSAASIMEAVDRQRYHILPVGITRDGIWIAGDEAWHVLWERRPLEEAARAAIVTDPRRPGLLSETAGGGSWIFSPVDLAFPVLHGPFGEDGTVQGLLELAGIPYVGSGVLASATSMDKAVMKTLFQRDRLPIGPYIYFTRWEWAGQEQYWQNRVEAALGYPCFVKPANLGSSVGISRVNGRAFLGGAVAEALLYDDKVVLESFIAGREIECSVLGDLEPRASQPGEIIPCNDFYDYRAKYLDDRSELIIPAQLEPALEEKIKELACKAFQAVEASGLARVDFFVNPADQTVTINEINTIPGFTSISMYPKLWEASGIGYSELINRLLELAESRFQRRRSLLAAPPE
ncbi:MAG: D-alanine--D-alanine ligase family protein [Bacillota bacterium]